jgi:excisionase family DNA binding protein
MTGQSSDAADANQSEIRNPKSEMPSILTPSEVCSMLRIRTRRPQASVQNLARRHGLRVLRVGRRVVVQREDLESWLIRNAGTGETGTK